MMKIMMRPFLRGRQTLADVVRQRCESGNGRGGQRRCPLQNVHAVLKGIFSEMIFLWLCDAYKAGQLRKDCFQEAGFPKNAKKAIRSG